MLKLPFEKSVANAYWISRIKNAVLIIAIGRVAVYNCFVSADYRYGV